MRIQHPLVNKTLGWCVAGALRHWLATLDYKAVYADPRVDATHPRCRGRFIYLCWHEYLQFSLVLRGHCGMVTLASLHRDAEIVSEAAGRLGWQVVRGSTTRGGLSALRQLMAQRQTHLTLTPDGPRGPRRSLAQGAVWLASKLGLPIVCCGYGYDRPWRLGSWDRFAIPRPFTRARAVYGPAMEIPAGLDRDNLEACRLQIEQQLTSLTEEAEAWAESGARRADEMPLLRRRPAPAMLRRPVPVVEEAPSLAPASA